MQLGIDSIIASAPQWRHQNIGFLTNDAAKTQTGVQSRKALLDAGFNIIKLFSPEHGIDIKGADGASMEHHMDALTGLPVISLYGAQLYPSEKDIQDIDVLLFDIPDAGTRFYTYLWSMTYWIQTAAKYHKPVYILDRPNPLGGNFEQMVEGPYLSTSISSFIGRFNIPIKHQMTLGELAQYFNDTQHWNATLHVIPCVDWDRSLPFESIGKAQQWIPTSPALKTWNACLLYPGLCFLEATNISVARTSPNSFEWIGADWLDVKATKNALEILLSEDLTFELLDRGLKLSVIYPENYQSVFSGLIILKIIKDLHPQHFSWSPYPTAVNPTGEQHLSLLLGIENAYLLFDLPFETWLRQIQIALRVKDWNTKVYPYLLY
jgi:uncharacterized protein YbbC (DUF1343 family)